MDLPEKEQLIHAWISSANDDWKVVESLSKDKHYHHALFFCQLVLEKILKALCVKRTNTYPPVTHDLIILATKSRLELTDVQKRDLVEITNFNIEARYDIFKKKLYQKATLEYTKKYKDITHSLAQQFKELL